MSAPIAGRLERVDDDLVFGLAGKGRDAPGDDDLEALLRLEPQPVKVVFQITASMQAPSSLRPK